MFNPVDSKVSFPDLETDILKFWDEHKIFQRSVDERPEDNLFIFYEGPPTANARPGIHHVLPRVLKDLITRYRTMRGYRVSRKAGWDTHGLPVELEVEKELGLRSKPEIEAYGIAEFNERCRNSVSKYVLEWERLSERIAFWADLEKPYVTYHNDYIETVWWIFGQLWNSGLIYQDYRTTPHCPRCETSLSDHEVSLGYKEDISDPSVYIKFRVSTESLQNFKDIEPANLFLLAWTTTPWTLSGNTALAVKEDAIYGIYDHEGEKLIIAQELAESILGEDCSLLDSVTGSFLTGLVYEPLYQPELLDIDVSRFNESGLLQKLDKDEALDTVRRVIPADFVSLSDGAGVVHIAPAFGGEDFELGRSHNLLFIQPVDRSGIVAKDLPGAGDFVKDADTKVIADLEKRGLLFKSEVIKHTYPFCWRCDSPLLYYAKPSWYIATTKVREELISGNQLINWHPDHIKQGRFGNWLENNIDWAFSRERYWGTPLPFWVCEDSSCAASVCIGSRSELLEMATSPSEVEELADLHRPYIDAITLNCPECGKLMHRVSEVADAWFDSGAMPYAQWHYPFENQEEFTKHFPADYICEGIDQTRGWFYTLHAEATLLNSVKAIPEGNAYKNVISHGHILDEEGFKMSKSKGNTVEPWDVIDAHGADAIRWYMFNVAPAGASRRFSSALVAEGLRRFQLTLWNTYSFFVSYANIDAAEGLDPRQKPTIPAPDLDRWLLSELNLLVEEVTEALENYDATAATRKIDSFVEGLSNWYVRRSRRRFWRGTEADDGTKQSAYYTLYTALTTLSRLCAPFIPFMSEEIWRNLAPEGSSESVHLADWPTIENEKIDRVLSDEITLVRRIASLGRAARAQSALKIRQPVGEVIVVVRSDQEKETLRRNTALILEELNAKSVQIMTDVSEVLTYEIKPNLPVLGPRLGKELNALRAELSESDPEMIVNGIKNGGVVTILGHELRSDDLLVEHRPREGYVATSEGEYAVVVNADITRDLFLEGLAREIIRRVQDLRRTADFELSDRIKTWYTGDENLKEAVVAYAEYIQDETLSTELEESIPPESPLVFTSDIEIDGMIGKIAVQRE